MKLKVWDQFWGLGFRIRGSELWVKNPALPKFTRYSLYLGSCRILGSNKTEEYEVNPTCGGSLLRCSKMFELHVFAGLFRYDKVEGQLWIGQVLFRFRGLSERDPQALNQTTVVYGGWRGVNMFRLCLFNKYANRGSAVHCTNDDDVVLIVTTLERWALLFLGRVGP